MNYKRDDRIENLIIRLIDGDVSALGEIYEDISKGFVYFARILLNNKADAEDALHDFMIVLERKAKKVKNNQNLYAWMIKSFENMIKDRIRKYERHPTVLLDSTNCVLITIDENAILIKSALQQLKEEDRRLIYYKYWYGLSLSKIAELEKTAKSTIEYRVNKVENKLKKYII